MSGGRQITISFPQWKAWKRQGRKRCEPAISASELDADFRNEAASELARMSAQLEERQASAERIMSALSDQTSALEAATNHLLRDQANEMCRRLTETAGRLREMTDAALAQQLQGWRGELSSERERQRVTLGLQRAHITMEPLTRQVADSWLRDATLVHDLIGAGLPHERHAPGELAALDRRMAASRENARQGQPVAALALAQETYWDLSELRVEIELRDRERTVVQAIARETLLRIAGLAAGNARQVIAPGEVGNESPVDFDADYWLGGALSDLRSALKDLLTRVKDAEQPLTTGELRDVARVQGPELERRLSGLCLQAFLRILASQLRVNVTEIVAKALDEAAGYEVEDSAYEYSDGRRAFFTKLRHANGNEIVASVAPTDGESGRCVLRLLSYDHDFASQFELDARAQVVVQELRSCGLHADDQGSGPDEPDPGLLDFDSIRREAPSPAGPSR